MCVCVCVCVPVCVFICIISSSDMADSEYTFLEAAGRNLKPLQIIIFLQSYLGDLTFFKYYLKQYKFTDLHDK